MHLSFCDHLIDSQGPELAREFFESPDVPREFKYAAAVLMRQALQSED